jgi:hypothetical protein
MHAFMYMCKLYMREHARIYVLCTSLPEFSSVPRAFRICPTDLSEERMHMGQVLVCVSVHVSLYLFQALFWPTTMILWSCWVITDDICEGKAL